MSKPIADLQPARPTSVAEMPPAGADRDGDLPVVARLVVEVRSDGSRTVARGVLEDLESGQRSAVEARGGTPLALAASLMRSLVTMPVLARRAFRALLPGRDGRPR